MAFYVNGNPRTYFVNLGRRMNQYDLWEGFYSLVGYDAIFVQRGDRALPQRVTEAFQGCKRQVFQIKEKGNLLRAYTIGICRNFKGMKVLPFNKF
jgi:protein-L-isoaspartate O-methyltransferase